MTPLASMKILINSLGGKSTEIVADDEVVWAGYVEDADTLEEILACLGHDIERIDHSVDDENLDPPEEEKYFPPFGVGEVQVEQ